jgi:hypothetical protein
MSRRLIDLLEGVGQRGAERLGHQLGDAIRLLEVQVEHAGHVADRRLRLQVPRT